MDIDFITKGFSLQYERSSQLTINKRMEITVTKRDRLGERRIKRRDKLKKEDLL